MDYVNKCVGVFLIKELYIEKLEGKRDIWYSGPAKLHKNTH